MNLDRMSRLDGKQIIISIAVVMGCLTASSFLSFVLRNNDLDIAAQPVSNDFRDTFERASYEKKSRS